MTIPRILALSLIACWLLIACDHSTPLPATDQIALAPTVATAAPPSSQPYSPVLIPTVIPEATIAPAISVPITTVVATDFNSNADLFARREKTLFEIDGAVILHTPSQYSAETFPLVCDITKEIAHCHDEYLDITFTHPANWGEAVGVLNQSRYVGYSYEYRFTRQFESSISAAGGRSDQFMEPRDGFFTDYSGPDGRVLEERCATPDFMLCELVQPGVELMIRRASAEALCNPGPGIIWRPTAFIAVDLPDHPTINGLLFVTNFLSTALAKELAAVEPQPYPPQAASINCDEAGRLRYEEYMKRLAQQLHDNTLDAETQAHLQTLRAMAASFHGAAMPGEE